MSRHLVLVDICLGMLLGVFVLVCRIKIFNRGRKKMLEQGEAISWFDMYTRRGKAKFRQYAPQEDRLDRILGACWLGFGAVWAFSLYFLMRALGPP